MTETLNHPTLDSLVNELAGHPVSIKLALGDAWDGGDAWGSMMSEGFALCDFLHFHMGRGDIIPASLGYTPGCGSDDEDFVMSFVLECWDDSGLTAADVAEYLELLSKALDAARVAGEDY